MAKYTGNLVLLSFLNIFLSTSFTWDFTVVVNILLILGFIAMQSEQYSRLSEGAPISL